MSGVDGAKSDLESRLERLEGDLARANARIAELEAENRELRRQLEDERRKGKRQAGPFSKGSPKSDP